MPLCEKLVPAHFILEMLQCFLLRCPVSNARKNMKRVIFAERKSFLCYGTDNIGKLGLLLNHQYFLKRKQDAKYKLQRLCMLIEFTLSAPNEWYFFVVISSTILSIVLPTGRSNNKTLSMTISIDTLDSHLARVSWNAAMQRRHVIYQARCRAGNHVTDIVTSNTTVLFTGLNQLTTYTITVRAQALDGKSPHVSSEIRLTTPGWSPTRMISYHSC